MWYTAPAKVIEKRRDLSACGLSDSIGDRAAKGEGHRVERIDGGPELRGRHGGRGDCRARSADLCPCVGEGGTPACRRSCRSLRRDRDGLVGALCTAYRRRIGAGGQLFGKGRYGAENAIMHHTQAADVPQDAALLDAQALDGPQRPRVLDAQRHLVGRDRIAIDERGKRIAFGLSKKATRPVRAVRVMQKPAAPLERRLSGEHGGIQRRIATQIDRKYLIGQGLAVRHELAKTIIHRVRSRSAFRD